VRAAVPVVVATVIRPRDGAGGTVTDLVVFRDEDTITVSWRVGDRRHETVIDRSRAGADGVRYSLAGP
jgi:hypothetical protein